MIPAVGRLTFHFLHCPPSRQHRQEWTDGIASNFCAAEETADVEDDLRRGDDICTPLRGVVNTQSAPVSCHEGDAEAAGRRAGGQLGDVAQPLPRGGGYVHSLEDCEDSRSGATGRTWPLPRPSLTPHLPAFFLFKK